ncbi:MAG: alr0857 family protein [Pseudanabaena sp. ELA607]|jgi:hypothetical protein
MLKITYTETGFYLETTNISLETFAQERLVLSLRTGQPFYSAKSHASLLVPIEIPPDLALLEAQGKQEEYGEVLFSQADQQYAEVSLSGIWLSTDAHAEAGIFAAELSPAMERYVCDLWYATTMQKIENP